MVRVIARQPKEGEASQMSGKTPQSRSAKKEPKLSLKEKRAEKRAKQEPETFIKTRKGASS